MRISPISSKINRIYSPAPKIGRCDLLCDSISFCAKKDSKSKILSIIEEKQNFSPHISTPIILNTNEDNFEFSKMMVQDDSFPHILIPDILKNTNKENIESKIEAHKFLKGQKGKLKKDYTYAASALRYIEPSNLDTFKMMASRKNFPKNIMWSVLISVNEENKDMAELMIKNPDFPKERIANILYTINDDNKDVARALIEKKDFPREDIGLILSNVDSVNSDFCLYMLSDCDWGTYKIVDILNGRSYPD